MNEVEKDIFLEEWRYEQENELRRKKKQEYILWSAAAVDFKIRQEIEEYEAKRIEEANEEKDEFLESLLSSCIGYYGGDIITAIKNIHQARENIKEERKKAEIHTEIVLKKPPKNQPIHFQSMLITNCYRFSRAKNNEEAAAIAASIDVTLNKLDCSPELMKATKLSPELLAQARQAVMMGKLIAEGLEALERMLTASRDTVPLPPEERDKNLGAIMRMMLVNPSSIKDIHSKELDSMEINFGGKKEKPAELKKENNPEIELEKNGPSA